MMAFKKKVYHNEENCLNCQYPLVGKYCANCGQKAFLHKDSFVHMAQHFVGDYFHYDNKFWVTLKTLFTKPGQATLEYIDGKRAKFLNPIQLYIFATTTFFLLALSAKNAENEKSESKQKLSVTMKELNGDSIVKVDLLTPKADSTEFGISQLGLGNWTPKEATLAEYDSVQQHSIPAEKHSWIRRKIVRKTFTFSESDKKEWNKNYLHSFKQNIPKAFFLLLPFFALLLMIFFGSKGRYYVDHVIFSLHFHSFIFILLILDFLVSEITPNSWIPDILRSAIILGLGIYLLVALQNVYKQSYLVSAIKQVALTIIYFFGLVTTIILLAVYIFFSM